MPINNFYENQGCPENLWDAARFAIRGKSFWGSTSLAPTVATQASWAIDGVAVAVRAWVHKVLFSTDTAINVSTALALGAVGLAAGTLLSGQGATSGAAWAYRAQVAVPTNINTTFGKIFVAANTTVDLLAGAEFVLTSGRALVFQTALVAANCTLTIYWGEFDD